LRQVISPRTNEERWKRYNRSVLPTTCQITRVSSDVKNKRYELSVLKLFSATE
jgi:hypothetical protein